MVWVQGRLRRGATVAALSASRAGRQRGGQLSRYHWYFKAEVEMMLRAAGFADIQVTGDYTDEPFGPQHTGTIVFVCRKA